MRTFGEGPPLPALVMCAALLLFGLLLLGAEMSQPSLRRLAGVHRALVPPLEPGCIAVEHHHQSHRLLVMLPNVVCQAVHSLQDESIAAMRSPGLYVDPVEVLFQDRAEEPFLFDVLTEQQASQLLLHSTRPHGR